MKQQNGSNSTSNALDEIPELAEARELAEALIRNAPKWDDNEKPVDPDIHRLWVGYGVRVALSLLALLNDQSITDTPQSRSDAHATE